MSTATSRIAPRDHADQLGLGERGDLVVQAAHGAGADGQRMVVLHELVGDAGRGKGPAAVGLREEAAIVAEPVRHDEPDLRDRQWSDRDRHDAPCACRGPYRPGRRYLYQRAAGWARSRRTAGLREYARAVPMVRHQAARPASRLGDDGPAVRDTRHDDRDRRRAALRLAGRRRWAVPRPPPGTSMPRRCGGARPARTSSCSRSATPTSRPRRRSWPPPRTASTAAGPTMPRSPASWRCARRSRAITRRSPGRRSTRTAIVVLAGAQSALFTACQCLLEAGDEAIVPEPMYVTYPATVAATGRHPGEGAAPGRARVPSRSRRPGGGGHPAHARDPGQLAAQPDRCGHDPARARDRGRRCAGATISG